MRKRGYCPKYVINHDQVACETDQTLTWRVSRSRVLTTKVYQMTMLWMVA